MSTPQEIRAIVKRFTEPWNTGNLGVLDEVCAPNYCLGEENTLEDLKNGIRAYRKAIPDLHCTLGEVIVEGNSAAYRWTMQGTHGGEFQGYAPTGKKVSATGITIVHFAGGKIVHDEFESSPPSFEEQFGMT